VEAERLNTAEHLPSRQQEFLELKVEGVRECAEILVVALMDGCAAHIFGRRTLPEMDLASAACAIQNLWLAPGPKASAWVGCPSSIPWP